MRWVVFLYPLAELWSLIELGTQTSASATLLWVLVAGFAGVIAIRFAGMQVLDRLQQAQREGALHQNLVAGDMALAFAGLLLIVPGLISDALAVLVLIPPLRGALVRLLGFRVAANSREFTHNHSHRSTAHHDSSHSAPFESAQGVTLEGEFQELNAKREMLERQNADRNPHTPD